MSHLLYDRIGGGYSECRRPDERIATRIDAALGQARTVLNVGAGAGSYEPVDRSVVALEPSGEMIRQRARDAAPVVQGAAGRLPFVSRSFDAALAILTIHHWSSAAEGLAEMRRVARDRIVIFTWDPGHPGFWLVRDYFPQVLDIDRPNFPTMHELEAAVVRAEIRVVPVPVPADCTDGFLGAYWRRPAMYLDAGVRSAISTFSKFDPDSGLARLRADIDDGTWSERNSTLHALTELDIGYRLIVARLT